VDHELAQVNVARLRDPLDAPETAEFVAGLAPVNALADAAPGFVWRLQGEAGDATGIRVGADPMLIVNLSVWESIEALRAFVYSEGHLPYLRGRRAWFTRLAGPSLACWWVAAGHRPTTAEAMARLARIEAVGPGPDAFDLRRPYDPAGAPLAAPAGAARSRSRP